MGTTQHSDESNILNNIRIVLCQTSHPGNIGSAARALKTMGLSHFYLVKPKQFPDAQASSLAASAEDLLEKAVVTETLSEALIGCAFAVGVSARKRYLSHEAVNAREAAIEASSIATTQPVAFVFGTEISGLSNAELGCCQRLTMIPANPEYSSLNLAAAVQIICYELRMAITDGKIEPQEKPERALNEDLERFYAHLEETLIGIGFLNPNEPKKLGERLRRIYARAQLEKEEVSLLRGVLTLTQKPRKPTKN
ncbi:MAG: RNA methyltransferase [Methylophilaceae bacterium]